MKYQFKNGTDADLYVKILIDSVKHPKKYAHVINIPGKFDTIELLKKLGITIKN